RPCLCATPDGAWWYGSAEREPTDPRKYRLSVRYRHVGPREAAEGRDAVSQSRGDDSSVVRVCGPDQGRSADQRDGKTLRAGRAFNPEMAAQPVHNAHGDAEERTTGRRSLIPKRKRG